MIRKTEGKRAKRKDYQEADTDKNSIVFHFIITNRMDNHYLLCQEIKAHHKIISIREHWKEYLHIKQNSHKKGIRIQAT